MHITIILKTVVMFAGKIKCIFLRFLSAYVAHRNILLLIVYIAVFRVEGIDNDLVLELIRYLLGCKLQGFYSSNL